MTEDILGILGIENWTITNGKVNVYGDVDLSMLNLTRIPVQFGVVTGDFSCSYNRLISLYGAPKKVTGDFSCSNNQLKSLKGAPKKVGGGFYCSNNQLKSLKGAPKKVGGDFSCSNNQLRKLTGAPKTAGNFWCNYNLLRTIEDDIVNKTAGKIFREHNIGSMKVGTLVQ